MSRVSFSFSSGFFFFFSHGIVFLDFVFLSSSFLNQEMLKLCSSVMNYVCFLFAVPIVTCLAFKLAPPAAVASAEQFLFGGNNITVTIVFFAQATVLLQIQFARVLKPSPRLQLTPFVAWALGFMTWICANSFFLHCLYDVGGDGERAVAAGASAVNLLMSARTVMVSPRCSSDPFSSRTCGFTGFVYHFH